LLVSGAAAAQLGRLKRAQGVAWSRRPQGVFGRMRHGRLIFASHVI
jgi:hypothetical protein